MTDNVFFEFKRLPPNLYPEPRDIRSQLQKMIIGKYKGKILAEIDFSTEFILKTIKPKDPTKLEKILLKYQVINIEWDFTKINKETIFTPKMFKWERSDQTHDNNSSFD